MGRGSVSTAGLETRTASPVPVVSSATVVTLLAENRARVGFSIFNDADKSLYVRFGTGATTTDFTVKLISGAYYENPPNANYNGVVTGIWASGPTGNGYVTELTEF